GACVIGACVIGAGVVEHAAVGPRGLDAAAPTQPAGAGRRAAGPRQTHAVIAPEAGLAVAVLEAGALDARLAEPTAEHLHERALRRREHGLERRPPSPDDHLALGGAGEERRGEVP